MRKLYPKDLSPRDTLSTLTAGVGPRPIALVSTLSKDGINNLAPFSFFNAFGSNPPIVAFSPAKRGRDGTNKDTYHNLMDTKECVIHAVSYEMAEKMNTASAEFAPEVDEFKESGFTPIDSELVKPKRVKQSPFQMECRLQQMVHLGNKPGSGNLAICEVLIFHVSESVYTGEYIDTNKLDLIGRNGGIYYTRASGNALFEIPRPPAPKT